MRRFTLQVRSATYHWRMNLSVALGVAVAGAALTGALLVGDSMRQSLRDVALGRLGRIDHALVAQRYFAEDIAGRLSSAGSFQSGYEHVAALILQTGGATNTETGAHAEGVNILGIDPSFWNLGATPPQGAADMPARSIAINKSLADELGVDAGGDVLLRMGKPSDVSTETLLGRRDETTAALRLPVHAVIPDTDLGAFSIRPQQTASLNAYVPLGTLQRAIDKRDRVNALLVSERIHGDSPIVSGVEGIQNAMELAASIADFGVTLRVDQTHDYVALETETILVDPVIERAAMIAAEKLGLVAEPVLSYLANRIEQDAPATVRESARLVPYSTVAAVAPGSPALANMRRGDAGANGDLQPGGMLLNEWTATDLAVSPGDTIALSYYVTSDDGQLQTQRHSFTLAGVFALEGAAADPGWIPPYPGVTDTKNLADWNAPFPIDFALIRNKDEAYWDEYRTAPKAFVSLEDGQRLWAHDEGRLGRLTSIRLYATDTPVDIVATAFESALLEEIDVADLGLRFEPVRRQAIDASMGSTDFGMLFIGFSLFLIVSAAMLVALLFRLGVERRCKEVGLLLAVGHTPQSVRRLLLSEGLLIAGAGGLIGLAAAQTYAWLMLAGLRTWWSSAANAPFLKLHVTSASFAIGYISTIAVSIGSIAWSIRGMTNQTTRSLLAGVVGSAIGTAPKSARIPTIVAVVAFVSAIGCMLVPSVTSGLKPAMAFFSSGALVLTACLAWLTARLRRVPRHAVEHPGTTAMIRLGMRNAPRNSTRSVLTAGLVASATFLISSLQVFRVDTDERANQDKASGVGGFSLIAESAVPLPYDLAATTSADALGLGTETTDLLANASVMSFRLEPGDDSSCLSLYQAKRPRILGAPPEMIRRGGFSFSSTVARSPAERDNPWLLLDHTLDDGAIPVIGDDSSVLWLLKSGLGKDFVVTDERNQEVRLRFVALLSGSVLRNELIIAEPHFKRLFPSRSGKQFFLIEAATQSATILETSLERDLSPFSMDAVFAAARLNDYLAVQNTYLSTFQMLGGLGLVLGTLGLAAVMLRNVWERRKELALLRAVGFSQRSIAVMVLSENAALLLAGLLGGGLAAGVAVAPSIVQDPGSVSWQSLSATLAGVFVFGFAASSVALVPTLRGRMIDALRSE